MFTASVSPMWSPPKGSDEWYAQQGIPKPEPKPIQVNLTIEVKPDETLEQALKRISNTQSQTTS